MFSSFTNMNKPTLWRMPLVCATCVFFGLLLPGAQAQSTPASFTSAGHQISVDWYPATSAGQHPVIIYLYGLDGMLLFPQSYTMLGSWLATQGYDVFVIHYFDRTGSLYGDPFTVIFNYGPWM